MESINISTSGGLRGWGSKNGFDHRTGKMDILMHMVRTCIKNKEKPCMFFAFINAKSVWLSLPTVQNHFFIGEDIRLVFLNEMPNGTCRLRWTPPFGMRNFVETCGRLCVYARKKQRLVCMTEPIADYTPDWVFYEDVRLIPRVHIAAGDSCFKKTTGVSQDVFMELEMAMEGNRMHRSQCVFKFEMKDIETYVQRGDFSDVEYASGSSAIPSPPRTDSPRIADGSAEQTGEEDLVRNALSATKNGEGTITSLDCIQRMYKEDRPYRAENAFGTIPLKYHRAVYKRDIEGHFVQNDDGARIAEEKAYDKAKEFVVQNNCAMFAFDIGADTTGMDEKEAKRIAFCKQYMTGSFLGLYRVFEQGNTNLWRWNRELYEKVDLGLHRNCYECLFFWRATKFFADLEFGCEYNPTRTPDVIARMMDILIHFVIRMAHKLCNITLTRGDFIVIVADSANKISRHLICLNPVFMFRTMMALSWFYVMCEEELKIMTEAGDADARLLFVLDKNNAPICFWDFCTTKEFQLFRVLFADKFQANRPLKWNPEFNDLSDPESYASQFHKMSHRDKFLNALVQTPWKMKFPPLGEENYVDFTVGKNVQIGRFNCIVNEGMLLGFDSRSRRTTKSGKILRVNRSISSNAGDLTPEQHLALRDWILAQPFARNWVGDPLKYARYKFTERQTDGNYDGKSVMIEMKGDVFCYRRRNRLTDPEFREQMRKKGKDTPTHSNCPVLVFIGLKQNGLCPITQTCNKRDQCGMIRAVPLGNTPKDLGLLLVK